MLSKVCQFSCLPQLTSLDSRKWADLSGGPCSLDNAMVSVSMLHNLAGIFYTLCPQCEFAFIGAIEKFMEFSVDCCNACVCKPKIWPCKHSIIFELFGLCVAMGFTWLSLGVMGVSVSMGWIVLISNMVMCNTIISMITSFWPFRMLVVPQ